MQQARGSIYLTFCTANDEPIAQLFCCSLHDAKRLTLQKKKPMHSFILLQPGPLERSVVVDRSAWPITARHPQ